MVADCDPLARTYDPLGRLEAIATSRTPVGTIASYTYTHNALDQRTRVTREDNSYWSYGYNDRGELTSAKKYWSDNSPVAGQQREYVFDSVGNRTLTKTGGDGQGLNLHQATYTANSLNQYQQRIVPGVLDVLGTANASATVTVNNQATYRRGDYFYQELPVDNSSAPAYQEVKTIGVRSGVGGSGEDAVTQVQGYIYVPKNVEVYTYDDDGNLTSDGRWNYTWDAENRLSTMEAITAAPVAARLRLEFAYDGLGRRIQKKVYDWNLGSGSYVLQSTIKFVYDGWSLIAELDQNGTLIRSYTRGQDISGTLFGAAGTGGLLIISDTGNTYQVTYDANGNVALILNASDGATVATYDYDPAGKLVQTVGPYATTNPITFGTTYTDKETQLLYYGYRYYEPGSGRWLSKDPVAEAGGLNLYAFLANDGINSVERLGLDGLVVAGGTSVNDPGGHDKFPWNFLNAAARRANKLVEEYRNNPTKYPDAKVYVLMYTPSYELRAIADRKLGPDGKPDKDFFVKIMEGAAAKGGWTLVKFRSKDELSYHFNKSKTYGVSSIDYFGHSDRDNFLLDYSSNGDEKSSDFWNGFDALNVRKEIFTFQWRTETVRGRSVRRRVPTATFASYGCYQGEEDGLAQRLNEIWGVVSKGAIGKTDYVTIGQGHIYPAAPGGFKTYQ